MPAISRASSAAKAAPTRTSTAATATRHKKFITFQTAVGMSYDDVVNLTPEPGTNFYPRCLQSLFKLLRHRAAYQNIHPEFGYEFNPAVNIRRRDYICVAALLSPVDYLNHEQTAGRIHYRREASFPYRHCNFHNVSFLSKARAILVKNGDVAVYRDG